MNIKVIILAAGKGTRMKSEKSKVMFSVAGKPMIDYVLFTAKEISNDIVVVVNDTQKDLLSHLDDNNINYVFQEKQLGTGDAVKSAIKNIEDFDGKVLILCGDMPLVKAQTLKQFVEEAKNSDVALITTLMDDPTGYGRIIRDGKKQVLKIVEEKDANDYEKRVNEVNTGIYLVDFAYLKPALENLKNDNAQGEYYLTDIVKSGSFAYLVEDSDQFLGVNDRVALYSASKSIWRQRAYNFMKEGVTIMDVETFYCDESVKIENDVVIYPNVFLEGETVIKKGCKIYSGVRIVNSIIEEDCEIKDNTLIEDSKVGKKCSVGPMAHLRPGTILEGENKIGNFVETKKIFFGKGSKASHLTYLGDAEIGRNVNVGCGTITCNYDGFTKHKTVIGDEVFVGSDVQFVAPVKIGKGALIAAGSTVTKDVPDDALAITRAEQRNIEGWVPRWRAKKMNKEK
ncbi:UDP-N-acetylglucosamine diphosphorylase/glucosamine-1-phosphate N-acetyltransferase [Deferribacter autotrophicus]|uniref:Bifunctional protein GlmU n=1 Tax=Deferribacter autotrophicus TaxID=500465 RepID=A0A5A8F5I7_9BACT|nr:bifunctional UDP-N-acetylglucosamine diphosphorylase/glucosamine-1-phosphate N-acetyltransferase GlmU [Deferribacter autotrophicus]KAA0258654.1 UDP-N-acetylglucosamine diphosphorylase/glucosamine-1-phosphate N-acetyltransferase [Deferribacter autotrophicus]